MADLGNTAVISPTDASNGSGTHPSWLGSAAPNTLDDAGRAFQGAVAREWENRGFAITSSGTAPTFVVAYTVAPAAYRAGQVYSFIAHAAAVGSETANVNALGAKNIRKVISGSKTALAANDFYTGDFLMFAYDGTDLVWLNPYANTARTTSANTFTADQTFTSTDAGAGAGPLLNLYRNSASPAASDYMGGVVGQGKSSTGVTRNYASLYATISDPTNAAEYGQWIVEAFNNGTNAVQAYIANGFIIGAATGGFKGAGTVNATEYYKNGVIATRALIATLTTSSGTTQSVTSIPAYRELYIELAGVSFTATATMTLAVSDDNGANYGTARAIAVATGSAAGVLYGTINVTNIQTSDSLVMAHSNTAIAATATSTLIGVCMAEAGGAPAVINAIQFAGGTFDAGTIRVYGLL